MIHLLMQIIPPLAENQNQDATNWQVILPLLVGVLSPLVVAVITRWNASSGLKAVLNLLVSAVGGYLTQLLDGVTLREAIFAMLVSWLTAVLSYQQIHSKLGTTQGVALKTRHFGVGGDGGVNYEQPSRRDPSVLPSDGGAGPRGRPEPRWD